MTTTSVAVEAGGSGTPGPGTPFVLVHGFADTAATWDCLVPLLHEHGPVYRSDLPGHGGRASDSAELMSRDAAVAELTEQITALGRPVTLVGHSLGGYLALTLAIRSPELVGALVLVCSGPGFRDPEARRKWNGYMDVIAAKNRLPERVAALGHQPDSFVIDHLRGITCPIVHVLGAEETRYLAGAQYLRQVFPTSRLVLVPRGGHHPQVEAAADVAAAILTVPSTSGA